MKVEGIIILEAVQPLQDQDHKEFCSCLCFRCKALVQFDFAALVFSRFAQLHVHTTCSKHLSISSIPYGKMRAHAYA